MPPFVSQIGWAEAIRLIRVSVRSVRFVLFRCVSGRGGGRWTVDGGRVGVPRPRRSAWLGKAVAAHREQLL
jgi:hypothetical protein